MNEDQKARLAAILSKDAEAWTKQQNDAQQREARMTQARNEWTEKVQKEMIPGLEPIVNMLRDAGWQCDVIKTPEGFRVSLYRGDMRTYHGRERPYLLFEIQHGYEYISVTQGTPSSIGSVDGGGQDLTVGNATVDRVTKMVTDLVEKLALK